MRKSKLIIVLFVFLNHSCSKYYNFESKQSRYDLELKKNSKFDLEIQGGNLGNKKYSGNYLIIGDTLVLRKHISDFEEEYYEIKEFDNEVKKDSVNISVRYFDNLLMNYINIESPSFKENRILNDTVFSFKYPVLNLNKNYININLGFDYYEVPIKKLLKNNIEIILYPSQNKHSTNNLFISKFLLRGNELLPIIEN